MLLSFCPVRKIITPPPPVRFLIVLNCYVACIRGTYKRYSNTKNCTACPTHSTTASVGSTLIDECYCFTGYEGDPANNVPCTGKSWA